MRGKDITQSIKKAILHSLGCKVNQVETESVAKLMRDRGIEVLERQDYPDLIFVNTCCVTGRAEAKSRRFVGRVARQFPSARIIAAGCLAELKPDDLKSLSPNIVCLGTFAKDSLGTADSVLQHGEVFETHLTALDCKTFGSLPTPTEQARSRAFLKIQDGCSQRCSYCIVPETRGPSRSMDLSRALDDIARLDTAGYPEIVLTGIHLGAYGRDLAPGIAFDDFVSRASKKLRNSRLRISSIEPQEVSDKLIEIVAENPGICNHFHIPVQNLDDRILTTMRRPYNSRQVFELSSKIFKKIPAACIGADIMVGFPGEDDNSFRTTFDSVLESGFAYLHVFPFSRRPGVPASEMKGAPDRKAVSERVTALRDLSGKLRANFYRKFVGHELEACFESGPSAFPGHITARTDNYILVEVIDPEKIRSRSLFKIIIESARDELVIAKLS